MNKRITFCLWLIIAASSFNYAQSTYFWNKDNKVELSVISKKRYVVLNTSDTLNFKHKISQNQCKCSAFNRNVSIAANKKYFEYSNLCWSIVETSSPISIPSNSSIEYMTPHFTLTDATTVGISSNGQHFPFH